MDKAKKVVKAFLNSAEGYFHTRRVIEDQVKQPRDIYGPQSDRSEKWDYKDIRDMVKQDYDKIIQFSFNNIDWELYSIIPSTALNASLGYAIHSCCYGEYAGKIDSRTYSILLKILALRAKHIRMNHGF